MLLSVDASRLDKEELMRRITVLIAVLGVLAITASATASNAGTGQLFLNGGTVGTVVPPAATPNAGTDPFFVVTNGAAGQLGIAGIGPGEVGYHGGHWAVSLVTFKSGVTPYLLTSDEAVGAALAAGDVTVTRAAAKDFLCPITA
jgi:hypothetical protein